ncbi:MAG TPA: DUF2306 domain-containing protein [Chloroflexota bacterium]|nr:DUF2306 domain-containing protein [Chloroflexota bacterium]
MLGLTTPLTGRPISPAFAALLALHVAAGLTCVITGAVALLSKKRRGRHPRYGEVYYWALGVVFVTATGMAVLHWPQNAYLFVLGSVAFALGSLGYAARKRRWRGWLTLHIAGMSGSYVVLLTAFYVDNGPHLPVWQRLPAIAFWVGPSAIGLPLIAWTLRRRTRPLADIRASVRALTAAPAPSGLSE